MQCVREKIKEHRRKAEEQSTVYTGQIIARSLWKTIKAREPSNKNIIFARTNRRVLRACAAVHMLPPIREALQPTVLRDAPYQRRRYARSGSLS